MGLVWAQDNLVYNDSDSSTGAGWYQVDYSVPPRMHDLALVRMPIKEIVAWAGDQVTFSKEGVYVKGELLPNSAPEAGIPHYPFGTYIVPKDFFLGMGIINPDSWDGRYLGFLPQSLLAGTVTPLWR